MVTPGIEPFVLAYFNSLIDNNFVVISFMKAIELALH